MPPTEPSEHHPISVHIIARIREHPKFAIGNGTGGWHSYFKARARTLLVLRTVCI